MINTNTSIASTLSELYTSTGAQETQLMSQIASGKRVQNPSDDFAAYVKAQTLNGDIASQQTLAQGITAAQGMATYATQVGNNIASDLTQLQNLQAAYTAANGDATQQASLTAQYNSVVAQITDTTTNSMYNGTAVYSTTALTTANVNTSGGTIAVKASAIGGTTGISNITTAVASDIQNEINNAQAYVSDMGSVGNELTQASALSDTIISTDQASVSALTDDNEAEDMTNLTNLQVRQQAIVSMMSQANTSQAGIARLFS